MKETCSDQKKSLVVNVGSRKYEVGTFASKHPGGAQLLLGQDGKDIGKYMRGIPHKHSRMAHGLLEEYRLGTNTDLDEEDELVREKRELESLVDWNRGMVRQVGLLGSKYERWVDFPVDREMILFDSLWMERLTKTPWYIIPIFWIPVILCFLAISPYSQGRYIGVQDVPAYLSGVLMWTPLEYLIHRFIFHMTVPKESRVLITLHFLLHGIHHKAPFDQNRLVLPPVSSIIYLIPIYLSVWLLLPSGQANAALAGIITGYVTYDLCHYYLHHGKPDKRSFLHQLKRYHSYHHFVHHTLGFGVTSKIWDIGFGTDLILDSKCEEH